jgi:hypothetical protein
MACLTGDGFCLCGEEGRSLWFVYFLLDGLLTGVVGCLDGGLVLAVEVALEVISKLSVSLIEGGSGCISVFV